jgi:hypothetical protein
MQSVLTVVLGLVMSMVAAKIREREIQRQQYLTTLKETAEKKQQQKISIKNKKTALENYKLTLQKLKKEDKTTEEL